MDAYLVYRMNEMRVIQELIRNSTIISRKWRHTRLAIGTIPISNTTQNKKKLHKFTMYLVCYVAYYLHVLRIVYM